MGGGKLMTIDSRGSSKVQQIFFDDNIAYQRAKIVDVRDLLFLDKPLWVQYLLPCHLVRAEPLDSVSDRQYFINHIERLSTAYEARLKAKRRLRVILRKAVVTKKVI